MKKYNTRPIDFTGCHPVKAFYVRILWEMLWGLRGLKFDGAIAPRVLRFDAPPARGLWWRL